MKSLSSLHRIRVLGRELQVRTTAPPERVRQIEEYLNRKVQELEVSTKSEDQLVIAILALLNITELFFDLSTERAECSKSDEERISRLLRFIENTIR